MEDRILEILKGSDKALSVQEIYDLLVLRTTDELKDLLKVLNKMEDELQIYRTKKDKYLIFTNSHLKIGTLIGNKKGFGFVDIEGDQDVFIAPPNMNNAIHGDRVIVEIISKNSSDKLEGKIIKIIERSLENVVGEFIIDNGKNTIKLDNDKLKLDIIIDDGYTLGAMEGHKVLVKVCSKLGGNTYKGQVIKILGHKNDPGVDILSIAAKYNINDEFPEEVMNQTEKLPNEVSEEELVGRKDLRNEVIFTIDGAHTKDIDDAISIKKLENGHYELGVHIADVSYYVKEGTPLDEEAYDRGTSVYLADRVIPMLPHKLSNGICSLNPGVDRLAISCVMEIDDKGDIKDYDIFPSVINSKKKMVYDDVNLILDGKEYPEDYKPFADDLLMMKQVADYLRDNKVRRGCIDFDIDEAELVVDDKGETTDVVLRYRGAGEKLIEDFMIAANETVASHIFYMELPFVYRVHGKPSEEKIENFLQFIKVLGYTVEGKYTDPTPKAMQHLLDQLKDKNEFHILSSLLLRSMQKAVYDKTNIGHYGIASKCYTHFTSPIRRYPDTTVHRLLRTYLFENKMDKNTINYWDEKLIYLTEHASEKEKSAADCEREVDDMKIAEYMMKHIGEEYEGIVSSVVNFGLFIELPNLIEGLVKISEMKGDTYIFDETTFSVKGMKTHRVYRLGDKVKVKCVNANKEAKTVDFEIITGEESKEEK